MPFGFNKKYATPTQTGTADAFGLPRPAAPLVKYGGDDPADPANQDGGGNLPPNGCPKSVGWWWIPLGCAGIAQFLAWVLARR